MYDQSTSLESSHVRNKLRDHQHRFLIMTGRDNRVYLDAAIPFDGGSYFNSKAPLCADHALLPLYVDKLIGCEDLDY